MLESLATDLLNKYLGEFVENVSQDKLSIQMWKGQVDLEGLKLKPGALDRFDMPLDVTRGHIEHLEMRIPWNHLKSQPVVIVITGLYAVCKPRTETKYNAKLDAERLQSLKMKRLNDFELLKDRNLNGPNNADDSQMDGFTASLLGTIVNNIQVVVQDVHLRYEDTTSIPGQTLSAGVTLGSFEAQSTDSHWSEGFLQLSAPVNYKLLDVKDIACYINVTGDVVFPANCPDSEFYGRMQSMVGKGKKPVEGLDGPMQYLIKPISCNAKVKLNRTRPLDTSMPKVEVKVAITTLPLILREQQYETATNVAEAFTRIHRGAAYRRFKPSGTPSAAGRWKFALDCVRHDIRERNRRYTWAYFKSRRLAKIEYISAYVVKETQLPVPESVTKVLERLEKELTFEDIRYFRTLGSLQVRNNKKLRQAAKTKNQQPKAEEKKQTGWWGGLWATQATPVNTPEAVAQDEEEPEVAMTTEQRDELFEVIGYVGEEEETDSKLPADYVSATMAFSLDTGSFTMLTLDKDNKDIPIAELVWEDLHANVRRRVGSDNTCTELSLGGLYCNDLYSDSTHFKAVIEPRDAGSLPRRDSQRSMGLASLLSDKKVTSAKRMSALLIKEERKPLFSLMLDDNPLDRKADKRLVVNSRALVMVYNQAFLNRLVTFFTIPDELQVAHMFAAVAQQQLSQQTMVWMALHAREIYDIDIQVEAPNILFPQRLYDPQGALAIMDLGRLHVVSQTNDRQSARVQQKHSLAHTGSDNEFATPPESMEDLPRKDSKTQAGTKHTPEEMEALLYDKYTLTLSNAQVLVCQANSDWRETVNTSDATAPVGMATGAREDKAEDEGAVVNVVDKFSMTLAVENLITELNEYADMKVSATLPRLSMHATDGKILNLLQAFKGALKTPRAPPPAPRSSAPTGGDSQLSHTKSGQSVNQSKASEDLGAEVPEDILLAGLIADAKSANRMGEKAIEELVKKVLMNAHFEIGAVCLSIGDSSGATALATVTVTGGTFDIFKRTYDTTMSLRVQSLEVPDTRQFGGEKFPYIVSSRSEQQADSNSPSAQLIHASVRFTSPVSPELKTVCENYEVIVNGTLDTCSVNVIPEAIQGLRVFVATLQTNTQKLADEDVSDVPAVVDLDVVQSVAAVEPPVQSKARKVKVTLEVRQLNLQLVQAKRGFLRVGVRDVTATFTSVPGLVSTDGKIRSVRVTDLTGDAGPFEELLLTRGEEVLSFTVQKSTLEEAQGTEKEELHVKARAGRLRMVYTERLFQYWSRYSDQFIYAKDMYTATITAATEAATAQLESVTSLVLDVCVTAPIIVLPMSLSTNEIIVANLGVLTVSNQNQASRELMQQKSGLRGESDVYTIGLQDMSLFTSDITNLEQVEASLLSNPKIGNFAFHSMSAEPGKDENGSKESGTESGILTRMSDNCIISDTSFDLIISKLTANQLAAAPVDTPLMYISGNLIGLDIVLSQATYMQLFKSLDGNLLYKRDTDTSVFNLSFGDKFGDGDAEALNDESVAMTTEELSANESAGSADPESNPNQSNVQVSFAIPTVRLLLRSEMATADSSDPQKLSQKQTGVSAISHNRDHMRVQDLCVLLLKDFNMKVINRSNDVSIDVTLGGLGIDDLCWRSGEDSLPGRQIVTDSPDLSDFGVVVPPREDAGDSSDQLKRKGTMDSSDKLVTIAVVTADEKSPLWDSMDENKRTVEVNFNDLGLVLNLQTTVLLIDFFTGGDTSAPSTGQLESTTSNAGTKTSSNKAAEASDGGAELWTIRVNALVLTLNSADRALCRLDVGGGDLQIKMGGVFEGGRQITAKLGPGLLQDLTDGGSIYRNVFKSEGKDILHLRFTKVGTNTRPSIQLQDPSHPAKSEDSVLWVRLGSMQLLYTMRFFSQLSAWLLNFNDLQGVVSFMRTGEEQLADTKFYYDIAAPSPAIVVPLKSTSNIAYVAYPGNIAISNRYENMPEVRGTTDQEGENGGKTVGVDTIEIGLQAMKLFTSCVVPANGNAQNKSTANENAATETSAESTNENTENSSRDSELAGVQMRHQKDGSGQLSRTTQSGTSGSPDEDHHETAKPQTNIPQTLAVEATNTVEIEPSVGYKMHHLGSIMRQATLSLNVRRRLTREGTPEALLYPRYKVAGSVANVGIHLTDIQLSMFFDLLSGNLAEGDPSESSSATTATAAAGDSPELKTDDFGREVSLDFSLAFQNVSLRIYERAIGNMVGDRVPMSAPPLPLMDFIMDSSNVNQINHVDGNSRTEFTCKRFTVDDLRAETRGSVHQRILTQQKPNGLSFKGQDDQNDGGEDFLDYVYCNSPTQGTDIQILLRHSRLLMIPDFFMEAWSFIGSQLDISPLHDINLTDLDAQQDVFLTIKKPEEQDDLANIGESSPALNLTEKDDSKMKVSFNCMSPEAVFVYDFGSENSSAVVLTGSLLYEMVALSNGSYTWTGTLNNFGSYSYWLGHDDTRVTLLYPCTFNLQYSDQADEKDDYRRIRDMRCEAGTVSARVSMVEVDLLSRLFNKYTTFLSDPELDEASNESKRKERDEKETEKLLGQLGALGYGEEWCKTALKINNGDLEHSANWLITSHDRNKRPPSIYSVPHLPVCEQQQIATPVSSASPNSQRMKIARRLSRSSGPVLGRTNSHADRIATVYSEQLTISGEIIVRFYTTMGQVVQPLAEVMSCPLMVDVKDWSSKNKQLTINSRLSYDFFNPGKGAWEAFVQNHMLKTTYNDNGDEGRSLDVGLQEKVEVNVSLPLLKVLNTMWEDLTTNEASYWKQPQERVDYKAFKLRNRTGVPLTMRIREKVTEVAAGGMELFGFDIPDPSQELVTRATVQDALKNLMLMIQIDGFTELQPIELIRLGRACYSMSEHRQKEPGTGPGGKARHVYVMVDLMVEDNHRLIDVRSTVTIVNHLTRPINIRTYPENTKAVYSDLFIDPGATYAVPITQATDRFQVRALSCHDNEKSMDPDTDFCPDFVHWSRFGMSKKERTSRTAESATEEKMKVHSCPLACPRVPELGPFYIMMHAKYRTSMASSNYPFHTFEFFAPLRIQNLLPVEANIWVKGPHGYLPMPAQPGEKIECHTVDVTGQCLLRLGIDKYEMSDDIIVAGYESPIATQAKLKAQGPDEPDLVMCLENTSSAANGMREISLWVPFWVVNMTGLPLWCKEMSEGKTVETTLPQTRQGKVQMHSLDVGVKGGEEITLRANDTRYSSVLRLDATGNTQKIVLAVPERGTLRTRTQKQYELGVKVTYNTGVYARTRLVQILPNMLFLNVFGFPLEYVQDNLNDPAVTITPMKTMPFHWPAKRDVQLLRIRAKVPIPNSSDESGRNDVWNWSEPFALVPQQLTHFTVKLRGNRNRELVGYIPVSVTWVKAGHVVLFGRPYGKEPTNYVIRNNTALRLEYWQDGVEKETLSPHSEVVYGFDRLLGPQFINVQVSNDDLTARSYDMNSLINKFSPVEYLRVFQLVAMNDSVLEVCKTRDGQATIRLWPKRDRTAMEYRYQMWSLTANGTLVNPASGLIAQVYGDGLYPGARLYMNDPQRRATEQWQLLPMVPNISSARQTNLVWELDADDLKSGCFLKLAPRNPQSQLQNFRPVYLTQGTGVLAPRIDVDGPTRILEFSDGRPLSEGRRVAHGVSRASFRSLPGMASMGLLGSGGEGSEVAMATTDGDLDGDVSRSDLAVRNDDRVLFQAKLSIKGADGLGISVIDRRPCELAYVTVRGLSVEYVETENRTATMISLDNLQMDDQTFAEARRSFPSSNRVVFAPLDERPYAVPGMDVVNFTTACNRKSLASFSPKDKNGSGSLTRKYRGGSAEDDLEGYIRPVVHVVLTLSKDSTDQCKIFQVAHAMVQNFQLRMTDEFMFRMCEMFVGPDDTDSTDIDATTIDNIVEVIEEQYSRTGNRTFYLQSLQLSELDCFLSLVPSNTELPEDIRAFAATFRIPLVPLHNVRLNTESFALKHSFITSYDFFKTVRHFYRDQLMAQWYKVVTQGISAFSNSIGHSLASFALDSEFERNRTKRKEDQATSNPGSVMKSGLTGMTTGILGGISGIVSQPVRGAKDDGASGFMKGLGKGVVGAFTKPASGVMDFGLDTMSALRDSTRGPKCSATVMRLQRHIPPGGIIVPYSEHSAKGQRLFYSYQALTPRDTDQIDEGITEHYYAHSKLKNGHYLLITTQRILELEAQQGEGDSDSGCELQLQLHTSATVRGVCHVEIVRTGDEIMLHLRVERSQFRTAVSTPNTAASRNMSWTSSFKVPKPRSLAIEEGIVHCNAAALTHKGAVEMRDNIMAVVTLYQHELKVKRFED